MHPFDFGTEEIRMLWASALLGLVQLVLAVLFSVGTRGLTWAAGPRDDPGSVLSKMGSRVDRAYRNFLETFPIFAALVLVSTGLHKHSAMTALGAELYFYGRVIFVPVYAFGIAYLRTVVWSVAMAGIVLVLVGIWPNG
jgi:uncharacterized MAPEG superfamily protein